MMCWIFHKWSKWEAIEETGTVYFRWGKLAGTSAPYSEAKQVRKCQTCWKIQIEKVE